MELIYSVKFRRDYKKYNNKELLRALKEKIDEIKTAKQILQVQHCKKLREYETKYKIEIKIKSKIYWLLCGVYEQKGFLGRIKSEKYFKQNLSKLL